MELEPMSSFHFESSLPSSQTDPVGDVDEIPEFENNFELENNTNLEEISVKKCDICQETIRNPKFKKTCQILQTLLSILDKNTNRFQV